MEYICAFVSTNIKYKDIFMENDLIFTNLPDLKVSIGEVAKMFNVCIRTIRIYEKEGILPVERSESNHRKFGKKDIDIIKNIIFLTRNLKINISGIKIIFALFKKFNVDQSEYLKILTEITQKDV